MLAYQNTTSIHTYTHTGTLTVTHTRAARASKGKRDANRICQRHFPSTFFSFFAFFAPFAAAFLLLIVVVTLVVVVFCLIENVLYVICMCRLRIRTACGNERSLVMLL